MDTETNAFNVGSYCRQASVGKVKYFSVYSLRLCVPSVSLAMAWGFFFNLFISNQKEKQSIN